MKDKPSLEELALAHYGVMGMKWGQRKRATGAEIREARIRLAGKQENYARLASQRRKTAKGSGERAAVEKTMDRAKKDFLKDPDRVIATRMTRGEKAVAALLAPATGGATLSSILVSSAVSRRIEKKQDDGAYDKKK